MPSPLPAELLTTRLRLRPVAPTDADAIFQGYARDTQVCRYMIWAPHTDIGVTRDFIASRVAACQDGSSCSYVITERTRDVAIGMLEARLLATMVDIGYVLAPAHWGRGYMSEAVRTLANVALDEAGFFRVQAFCDAENVPSRRVLEKAGFAHEGRLARYGVHPNISPEPRDCDLYARVRG
jgi:ribosomal-protein-alanine N-acetyltransferase